MAPALVSLPIHYLQLLQLQQVLTLLFTLPCPPKAAPHILIVSTHVMLLVHSRPPLHAAQQAPPRADVWAGTATIICNSIKT